MEGIRHLKENDIPVIRELEKIGKKVKIDKFWSKHTFSDNLWLTTPTVKTFWGYLVTFGFDIWQKRQRIL